MSMESALTTRGRPLMFTPERVEQIRNLVERGNNREQIAEIIGCTPGTLAVMCSRLGISLRRPKIDNGMGTTMPTRPPLSVIRAPDNGKSNGGGGEPPPVGDPPPPAKTPEQQRQPEPYLITLSVRMEYKGVMRETQLKLPADAIAALILEAEISGMRLHELIAKIIAAVAHSDLLEQIKDKLS